MDNNIILDDVKRLLNIQAEDHEFDMDILSSTNSAFFTLHQLGVGSSDSPFTITQDTPWSALTTQVPKSVILDYLGLKVKLIFDPPSSSFVVEAYKDRLSELEFRMNIMVDSGGGNVTG